MLDALLKLIDYATKLVQSRRVEDENFFDRVVTPSHEVAERVLHNYLELFQELRERVRRGDSREELAEYIERGRIDLLPARMKLRALLTSEALWHREVHHRFVNGILGVLCGGLSTHEESQVEIAVHYAKTGHTLLDVLYHFQPREDRSLEQVAESLIDTQERAIKAAWVDVSESYAKMLTHVVKAGHLDFGTPRMRRPGP